MLNLVVVIVHIELLVPLIHLLNSTTRMPFEILFVMLIGTIVFPFALGIQCLHEIEKADKCSGS